MRSPHSQLNWKGKNTQTNSKVGGMNNQSLYAIDKLCVSICMRASVCLLMCGSIGDSVLLGGDGATPICIGEGGGLLLMRRRRG